jgi:hypothetical protein
MTEIANTFAILAVETKLPLGHVRFLQELVDSAAVAVEARAQGGDDFAYAHGVIRAAAIMLSLHHGVTVNEIEDEAERRAKEIFSQGHAVWSREIALFGSHLHFNQA